MSQALDGVLRGEREEKEFLWEKLCISFPEFIYSSFR